jgi:hypothetical protein
MAVEGTMDHTRRIVVLALVASGVILGAARGEVRTAKAIPSVVSTQHAARFTETVKLKKVGSATLEPTNYVSFGPMAAGSPAPKAAIDAGKYEVTDDDLGIFFAGAFVQDGAKLSLTLGGVSLIDWLYSRVEAVPGVIDAYGLSFPTVTAKGKVYADGSGCRFKVKVKFTASISYDLGEGTQNGAVDATLALTADTAP